MVATSCSLDDLSFVRMNTLEDAGVASMGDGMESSSPSSDDARLYDADDLDGACTVNNFLLVCTLLFLVCQRIDAFTHFPP